ncbi:activating signal cointegrator 1 complex subunit 1 [Caerostris darwini]|uniref:Activating signal cointegrator 1 complex subunit 1 n=1 Tax=Caerostris darwini TaxID=1538125 RepID=A0AAV4MWA9_9ARAC|nr:activating signal cointegrator 1 complex subunit 1 [Caerostris darwini]
MDILKAKLVWVDGRCYRQLPVRETSHTDHDNQIVQPVTSISHKDEDYENTDLPVKHRGDFFFYVFVIPKDFVKYVVGTKAIKKKQIEESTSTELKIPKPADLKNTDEADITIIGKSIGSVVRSYERIRRLVDDMRWRMMEFTHFISIPMNDQNIQEKFLHFKNDVLRTCKGSQGIEDNIFVSPAKLHLTIAMLTLLTKQEKEKATSILQNCKNYILNLLSGKPLNIEVKGVEYMNDEPEEVTVLYGKVKETKSNCLQLIANKLLEEFEQSPLGRRATYDDPSNVKLHVTLMKAKTGARGYRETFDASQILEKYADYSFGETTVSEIHLSVRFTAGKNYYQSIHVLEL